MENKILISSYKNVKDSKGKDLLFLEFLVGIRDGKWQDDVLGIRNQLAKTDVKSERSKIKQGCPLVRVSGSFAGQKDSDIRKHSGFIAIDLDDIDNPNTVKDIIKNDPFVYASFISVSGTGLCLIFRIDGTKHQDAFEALESYIYDTYQLISDKSCKNVSRARFVSYDPYIYINESAPVFKKYLKKEKQKTIKKVVFVQSDFDDVVKQLYDRGINICEDYKSWVSVCYALVSEFGDTAIGRNHFDTLSAISSKYHEGDCKKQYDSCVRSHDSSKGKVASIDLIYYHAKQRGIETYSQETKEIIRSASSQYKSGISKENIASGLQKFNDIPTEKSLPIIEQVIKNGIEHESENIIDDIISFLRPYELKKNLITRNVELNGKPLDDSDINTLFIECKSIFDKATKDLVCSVIFSNKIDQYNPVTDFFTTTNVEVNESYPNVNLLLDSVISDTPNKNKWIKKWLVSIVASAMKSYSPLVLVFCGETHGTGKTYWMRYLLPKKLRYLFAESDMDSGKDDEILMTKKLIILDDEYGGKSKKESKKLKKITSKEFINVREPYGRVSVDLRRLAVFCGTSNEKQILNDPTGNRRELPISIISLDHDKYNACDKELLWHELYHIYKSGFDYTVLKEEIQELSDSTEEFKVSSPEEELLSLKIRPALNENIGEWLTVTEIIKIITLDTKYVFSNIRIGILLSNFGYTKRRIKRNGTVVTAYCIDRITEYNQTVSDADKQEDKPPF